MKNAKKVVVVHPAFKSKTVRRAVDFLSEFILDLTFEYPFLVSADTEKLPEADIVVYLGTKQNNPAISRLSDKELARQGEYYIRVKDGTVLIEGYDEAGMLWGVMDFNNDYVMACKDDYSQNFPEPLTEFSKNSAPAVSERGIWTWGHVIYDYKGFLDNMARLKMNSIIIWNDFVPFNIEEIIDYAHALCIKVILGYSWGWDQRCKEISLSRLDGMSAGIFEKYEREYASLGIDGIYFQTVTELEDEYIEGVLVAEAVTDFVNSTCALFYEKYPELLIEFGLHATSVKNRLEYIARVDKRVRIVWEDFGAMPFNYNPHEISDYGQTKDIAIRAATLRGADDNYGIVPKSMICLDWSQFTHPIAPQNIGVSTNIMRNNRVTRSKRLWRRSVAGWLRNGEYALDTVRALAQIKGGSFSVNVLVEDGMFEDNIKYPVALFSEMLWNTEADYKTLVASVGMRDYVEFR